MKTPWEDTGEWSSREAGNSFLLALADQHDHVETIEFGTSLEGRPLYASSVGYPSPSFSGDTVLIVGGQHGNEPAGRESAYVMLRDLAEDQSPEMVEYLTGTTWVFVPTVNTDRVLETRNNADGINLNREWKGTTAPSIVAMMGLIDRVRPAIIMDLHEWNTSGFFIGTAPNLNEANDPKITSLSAQLEDHVKSAIEGAGHEWRRYPTGGGLNLLSQYPRSINLLTESLRNEVDPQERVDAQIFTIRSVREWHELNRDEAREATVWPEEPPQSVTGISLQSGGQRFNFIDSGGGAVSAGEQVESRIANTYQVRGTMPEGTDVDDCSGLEWAGIWHIGSSTELSNLPKTPTEGSVFEVVSTGDGRGTVQRFTDTGNHFWREANTGSTSTTWTWGDWHRVPSESETSEMIREGIGEWERVPGIVNGWTHGDPPLEMRMSGNMMHLSGAMRIGTPHWRIFGTTLLNVGTPYSGYEILWGHTPGGESVRFYLEAGNGLLLHPDDREIEADQLYINSSYRRVVD